MHCADRLSPFDFGLGTMVLLSYGTTFMVLSLWFATIIPGYRVRLHSDAPPPLRSHGKRSSRMASQTASQAV